MTRSKWLRPLALVFALAFIAAACGDDDSASTTQTGTGGADTASDTGGDTGGDTGTGGGEPAAVPGFDGTTIRLGVISALSGRVSVIGNPLTNGNRAFFAQLNAAGGIAGKYPVVLEERDSAYTTEKAIQEYGAIKGDIVMFAQLLGTPIVNALLPQLRGDNLVAAPASLDSFWVREQNLLPIGAPYQIQVINGVDWYINEGGGEGKKICSLTQDDPYGEAGQAGLDFAADKLGLDLGPQVQFTAGTTEYTTQINQLQGEGCEAVVLVATPADAAGALGKAALSTYEPQWLGQSPIWLKLVFQGDLRPYAEKNVVVLSEGPNWGDTTKPGMVALIDALEKYAPGQEPDPYFAFGYDEASSVAQVLERAVELGDLSKEGIIEAMNSLDELTFGGLLGDYGYGPPEERNPPRTTTIFKVDLTSPTGLTAFAPEYEADIAADFEFVS